MKKTAFSLRAFLKRKRQKLILHIGAHKTGSTAIQFLLSKNRDAFEKLGVLVPDAGRPPAYPQGNHELAWAIYRDRSFLEQWANLATEASRTNAGTVILSSEEFDRADERDVAEIYDLSSGYDTKVLLYIRRQVDYCEAFYRTVVEHYGYARSIQEYLQEESSKLDCYRTIRTWTSAFPRDRLLVRLYDRKALVNGDIVDDFLHVLGVGRANIPTFPEPKINHGLPYAAIAVIRLLSKHRYPKELVQDFRKWCHGVLTDEKYTYTILSRDEARSIMRRFAQTNLEIRNEFFPDYPEELFDSSMDDLRSPMSDFARFPELAEKVGGFFEHRDVALPQEIIDFTSSQ